MANPAVTLGIVLKAETLKAQASLAKFDAKLRESALSAQKTAKNVDGLNKVKTNTATSNVTKFNSALEKSKKSSDALRKSMDGMNKETAAGTKHSEAELRKFDAALSKAKIDADTLARSMTGLDNRVTTTSKHTRSASSNFSTLGSKMIVLNQAASLAGKTFTLMKFPALIALSGSAAQAISALTAGVVGLSGALAPATGLVTQYGTALGTLGQVKAVLALSGIKNVTTAIGGLTTKIDKTSTTWKKLNPQAQKFAQTLDKLQSGPLTRLQNAIQKPLFAGFNKAINDAKSAMPAFTKVLTGTAKALSSVAQAVGKWVGSKGFAKDFTKFGNQNNRVLQKMGPILTNLGKAFLDVMVAARPLTQWIFRGIKGWTEWLAKTTQAGRASGTLAAFFKQTKNVTSDLVKLIEDFGMALVNVMKLGAPLGNTILDSLVKSAHAFRQWTESASGQNKIAQWFKDAKAPLFEFGRLIHDVVIDIFKLGHSGAFTNLIKSLRTQLLPVLFQVAKNTSKAFGPELVRMLTQVGKLFGHLAGVTGPLTLYAKAITFVLKEINKLFKAHPILATITAGFLEFAAVLKAVSFLGAISGLTKLKTALFGVAAGETAATAAGEGGMLGGVLGKLGIGAGAARAAGGAGLASEAAPGLTLMGAGEGAAAGGVGAGTVGLAAAAAGTAALGGVATAKDVAGGGLNVGNIAGKGLALAALGPIGGLAARGARELPLVGGAIGGVEDKLSSLGHKVPVVGDVFDGVFGSGGTVPASIKDSLKALDLPKKKLDQLQKQLKQQGVDKGGSVGDAIKKLRDQYGTVGNAALLMGNKGRKSFLELARGAHENGKISDEWFRHIKNALGGTLHTFAKDIPGADKAFKNMGDVIKNLGNKTVPQSVKLMQDKFGSLVAAGHDMSKNQRDDYMKAAKAAHDLGDISDKQFDRITNSMQHNTRAWNDMQQRAAKVTGQTTKSIANSTGDATVKVSKSYGGMVEVVGHGLDWLTSNTSRAAQALGIKQAINFKTTPIGGATGSAHVQGTSGNEHLANQKGGFIPGGGAFVPGQGTGDKVHAMLEPGEFVLNRKAVGEIGAGRLNKLNKTIPRFAEGGLVQFLAGGGTAGLHKGIKMFSAAVMRKFPDLSISSGFRPMSDQPIGHPDYHNYGDAVDLVGPSMARAGHYVIKQGWYRALAEQINTAANGVNAGQLAPGFVVEPWNLHLAQTEGGPDPFGKGAGLPTVEAVLQGAAAGGVGQIPKLKRLLLKGPKGALRSTGQAALDKVHKAGQAFLKKNAPTGGGAFGAFPTGKAGKLLVRGKVSWFTGQGTAGGGIASRDAGVALNLNPGTDSGWDNPTTQKWMDMALAGHPQIALIKIGSHRADLPIIDKGPAGFTGRAIDVTAPGVRRLGMSTASFPTDSIGTASVAKQLGGLVKAMPPYGGQFEQGGIVPGPRGAPRTIVAHGGETVSGGGDKRYAITITNWKQGTGYMEEIADGTVNGQRRLTNQLSRMRK